MKKAAKIPPTPEFSRPVALASLHDGENVVELVADEAERAALARRLGLIELPSLSVRYSVWPSSGRTTAHSHGQLRAEVVQSCVVTLEPVRSRIAAEFDRHFAPENDSHQVDQGESFVDPEAEDTPDPVVDGAIDLGECAAEQLALEIDPFPRAPGAEFSGFSSDLKDKGRGEESPFAALAKLKGKL